MCVTYKGVTNEGGRKIERKLDFWPDFLVLRCFPKNPLAPLFPISGAAGFEVTAVNWGRGCLSTNPTLFLGH